MSADLAISVYRASGRPLPARPDRRISRTRRALVDALLGLTKEKPYPDVTVQEIIERADVSRSTFYMHFLDKDDLLVELYRHLRAGRALDAGADRRPAGEAFLWSREVLEWAHGILREYQAADAAYRWQIENEGCMLLLKELNAELSHLARVDLARFGGAPTRAVPDYVVRFVVDGFIAMLASWLEGGAVEPAAEIDRRFRALALPGATMAVEAARASQPIDQHPPRRAASRLPHGRA